MKTVENSPERLVLGGWRAGSIALAMLLLALPVAFYFLIVTEEPYTLWANAFLLLICLSLVPRMVLWERIELDRDAAEIRFDQLRLLGRLRRSAPLKPVSRVEVETRSSIDSTGRPSRRLVLVTGHERTPFSRLYTSGKFEREKDLLNDWLKAAFGERWREAATRFTEDAASAGDADVPDGVTRIRQPATGLSLDIPEDWAASVSLDTSGPLEIFGIRLLNRVDRPGKPRAPGDGEDWSRLVATGAEDAGLTLQIHDGPLRRTLEDTLNDPWSKQWGIEVLKTTEAVEMGGMRGFSIARRIPAGGSTPVFGKVGADAATRQLWLGAEHLHVEMVGMARLDDAEMQHALDAMFASVRLPGA
ncbi:hypothetical protein CKO31_13700 [Thiohalocapsa halophila]|uniref:DUF4429 domain-containing protein n=1 Tax=Thiohalocapsa halophila TaxID=69359 RepID=A0ABS1CIM8_9GAMM|nr:hypothetical protein [Thiohalocapsa halophila]MBK1631771.1 hypothetical protein [Thiohalocapsa halophila]